MKIKNPFKKKQDTSSRVDSFEAKSSDDFRHFYYATAESTSVCEDLDRLPDFIRGDYRESALPMCPVCSVAISASSNEMRGFI